MVEQRKPKGFKVQPRSLAAIRGVATEVRRKLSLGPDRFNAESLIDVLGVYYGITVHITENDELLEGSEGFYDPSGQGLCIYLPLRTYDQLVAGNPRGTFTLMHEMGHLILGHTRSLHRQNLHGHSWCEDSEWQANTFAAEIMMPLEVILAHKLDDAESLAEFFGVSVAAATYRLKNLKKRGDI